MCRPQLCDKTKRIEFESELRTTRSMLNTRSQKVNYLSRLKNDVSVATIPKQRNEYVIVPEWPFKILSFVTCRDSSIKAIISWEKKRKLECISYESHIHLKQCYQVPCQGSSVLCGQQTHACSAEKIWSGVAEWIINSAAVSKQLGQCLEGYRHSGQREAQGDLQVE